MAHPFGEVPRHPNDPSKDIVIVFDDEAGTLHRRTGTEDELVPGLKRRKPKRTGAQILASAGLNTLPEAPGGILSFQETRETQQREFWGEDA